VGLDVTVSLPCNSSLLSIYTVPADVRPSSSEVVVKPAPVHVAMLAGKASGAAGAATPITSSSVFDSTFSKRFTFDRTFDGNSTQEALFESSVAPIVDQVLNGFSCTLFCYGQVSCGKRSRGGKA
jgi:Kinesin motor domain